MARFVVIKRYDTSRAFIYLHTCLFRYSALSTNLCNQLSSFCW